MALTDTGLSGELSYGGTDTSHFSGATAFHQYSHQSGILLTSESGRNKQQPGRHFGRPGVEGERNLLADHTPPAA